MRGERGKTDHSSEFSNLLSLSAARDPSVCFLISLISRRGGGRVVVGVLGFHREQGQGPGSSFQTLEPKVLFVLV